MSSKKLFNIVVIAKENWGSLKNFEGVISSSLSKNLQREPKFSFVENYQQYQEQLNGQDINCLACSQPGENELQLLTQIFNEQQKNIEIIHSFSAGVDKFLPYLKKLDLINVQVTNAKGSFSDILGEYVVFSCYYFAKRVPFFIAQQRKKEWVQDIVYPVKNSTIAIVGLGDIGTEVARQCKANRMKIIGIKRNPNNVTQEQKDLCDGNILPLEQLDEALKQSDYVCSVLPKINDTNDIFNLQKFKTMKQTAVFINIGRGNCVVEEDLVTALKQNIIRGAALDVVKQEPMGKDNELWDQENALITHHCGDRTTELIQSSMKTFCQNLSLHLQQKKMQNLVDLEKGY